MKAVFQNGRIVTGTLSKHTQHCTHIIQRTVLHCNYLIICIDENLPQTKHRDDSEEKTIAVIIILPFIV